MAAPCCVSAQIVADDTTSVMIRFWPIESKEVDDKLGRWHGLRLVQLSMPPSSLTPSGQNENMENVTQIVCSTVGFAPNLLIPGIYKEFSTTTACAGLRPFSALNFEFTTVQFTLSVTD